MFEFIEKILKSEDLVELNELNFSNINDLFFSFNDIFSDEIIADLESLSIFKINNIDELPQKIIESEVQITDTQIQKIIEYIENDPVFLEKINSGINSVELFELIKEKKERIFSDNVLNNTINNNISTLEEKEEVILKYIKNIIPAEYVEKIIQTNSNDVLNDFKNNLNFKIENIFKNDQNFSDININDISNKYFENIINDIDNTNVQNSIFQDFENSINEIKETKNTLLNNINNIFNQSENLENVNISQSENLENINISQSENLENNNEISISNIEGDVFNKSILEGSTYNEFFNSINFNNIKSDINNLYEEINKTNEFITNKDFVINESNNIFDENIINNLTTKIKNQKNTEIVEVKEIINNLTERVIETHKEVEMLKNEEPENENISKPENENISKPDIKLDNNLNNNNKNNIDNEKVTEYQKTLRIPMPLPKFPNIGEMFV